jgi:hypothetical protein
MAGKTGFEVKIGWDGGISEHGTGPSLIGGSVQLGAAL